MSGKTVYKGTKGMNERMALNRIFELMDKQTLGSQDKEYYTESKDVLNDFDKTLSNSFNWEKVKDKLTAKQLLHILEGE